MAANRVKGITIEIGGDTTGLDKALKGTNSNIKNTQAQLKDVNRLLKFDPKNTELLAQKQKLLANGISETKNKLNTLKEAEKQVQEQIKQGKASQEQYDALKREIADATNELKSLQAQASKSREALQSISDKSGQVAQKTKGLSAAAGGLIAGLGATAYKSAQAADEINTLAKQTGLSTAEIQKYKYAADLIDVDLETITKSHAKLTKNMATAAKGTGDAAAAFKSLGVSVTNADGSLRNNKAVFNETIDALARVENETQRDAYAMAIFGKSAQDLNPLILGGSQALEQLGMDAENAGLILSQDTLDSANQFNDAIDTLKAKTGGSFAKIGAELATLLTPLLEKAAAALEKVVNWLTNLSPTAQIVILVILALVAAISPIASIISAISGAMAIMNAVSAASPTTWIILAIVAAVAALVAIGVVLYKNWDKIKEKAQELWQKVVDVFNGMKQSASDAFQPIKDWLDGVIEKVKSAIEWFKSLFSWKKKNEDGNGGYGDGDFGGRANGGPVGYGAYVVGEVGPELLKVSASGATVTPLVNNRSATFNNTFNFTTPYTQAGGVHVADTINKELGRIY